MICGEINKTNKDNLEMLDGTLISDAILKSSKILIDSNTESINNKKKAKNVSFSDIISTTDNKIPVFDDNVDSKTLIEGYIKLCDSFNTKPIDQLIIQLKAFEVIKGRLPNLDLKGNKLDMKAVESLESIFMKIKVSILDVESTMMDEEACQSLCEILQFYDSPLALHIGNNTMIGICGWEAIYQFICRSNSLEEIYLNQMVFSDSSIDILSLSLSQSITLRILSLSNCALNGTLLKHLSNGFRAKCLIEQLNLDDNKISSQDCEFVALIIRCSHNLRVLNLQNNPIRDLGLKLICDSMRDSELINIERLKLYNTGITSLGMEYLSNLLYRPELNNHYNNLKFLNIGKNKICDEGIIAIKTALIRNQCLKYIGLASSKLSPMGIITMGEILAENCTLIRVDLRDNVINISGAIALLMGVRKNNIIVKINLNTDLNITSTMETKINPILNQIQTKCHQNRQQVGINKTYDDTLSIFSSNSSQKINSESSDSVDISNPLDQSNTSENIKFPKFMNMNIKNRWQQLKTKMSRFLKSNQHSELEQ